MKTTLDPFNNTDKRDFSGLFVFFITHLAIMYGFNLFLTLIISIPALLVTLSTVAGFFYTLHLGVSLLKNDRVHTVAFLIALFGSLVAGVIFSIPVLTLGLIVEQESDPNDTEVSSRHQ